MKKKPYTKMTAAELAKETADLDREFVIDDFGPMDEPAGKRWNQAKRKRGRPVRGPGSKPISVTVRRDILRETDRLASKLRLSRAQLIEQGLRIVLARGKAKTA
jgi:hypothetical protein